MLFLCSRPAVVFLGELGENLPVVFFLSMLRNSFCFVTVGFVLYLVGVCRSPRFLLIFLCLLYLVLPYSLHLIILIDNLPRDCE